jgi:hypothetical protein
MAGKYLSLLVHFTWSTAGREPWLGHEMREDLFSYIGGILRKKKAKLISSAAGPSDLRFSVPFRAFSSGRKTRVIIATKGVW